MSLHTSRSGEVLAFVPPGSLLAAVLGRGLLWFVARRLTLPRWEGPYCREAMKPIKENCND